MGQIISASIDLSKIDKSRIVNGKNGAKYYNFSVNVNDEQDKFGNNVSVTAGQTKEERERKDKRVYIGNGRTVWSSTGIVNGAAKAHEQAPAVDPTGKTDDLPF